MRIKTKEQIANEAKILMGIEGRKAKQRQKELNNEGGALPVNSPGANNCEGIESHMEGETGRARDAVGEQLGISGQTVDRMTNRQFKKTTCKYGKHRIQYHYEN